MKSIIYIIFGLVLLYANKSQSQNVVTLDYISTGYYQLIYEADIAYLEGNEDLAFGKLNEAEKRCPLLNQAEYHEMELYCSLLMKRRKFPEAINYLEKLATEYGTLHENIINNLYYDVDSLLLYDLLKKHPNFTDSIFPSIMSKYEKFYTEERKALVEELSEMCEKDQAIRLELTKAKKDPSKSKEDINSIIKKMKNIDAENIKHLYHILNQYGFPNTRLLGVKNHIVAFKCEALFIHNYDDKNLKERLLKYVRNGECSPYLYGFMIDKFCLEKNQKYIYAIFDNTPEDKIKDVKYLDKRRQAIGMPSLTIEKKIREFQNKETKK